MQYDELVNTILNEGLGKNIGFAGAALGAMAMTGTPANAADTITRPAYQQQASRNPHHLNATNAVDQAGRLISKASDFISQWEGFDPKSYPDADGRSIGYGFFLNKDGASNTIRQLGYNYKKIYQGRQAITKEDAKKLLKADTEEAIETAKLFAKNFNELPSIAQLILIDMSYNLGRTRFFKFKNMREAINKKDYERASKEMKNSDWYGQVGNRSVHHVNTMRSLNAQK